MKDLYAEVVIGEVDDATMEECQAILDEIGME